MIPRGNQADVPPHSGTRGPETILIIYSVVETVARGEANDLLTDLETPQTARAIAEALTCENYSTKLAPIRSAEDLTAAIQKQDSSTTLVFNLCESLGGISTEESTAPRILDEFGFCYVGANPENLDACLDKGFTKKLLLEQGVPTADYQVFHTGDEPVRIEYPAIVKPVAEDCSLGLGEGSIVWNEAALRQRISYIIDTYKQAALVEVYLEGREFTASLWGNGNPEVIEVGEIDFSIPGNRSSKIVDFDSKWVDADIFPAIHPAELDDARFKRIKNIALETYRIMGCRDFARVDMREKGEELFVLDVNPNPSLYPGSGFAKAAQAAGYSYPQMAKKLVEFAWKRMLKRK